MVKRSRVLYTGKGCELSIETDGLNEKLIFTSLNDSGFIGQTLYELEQNANATAAAARNMIALLDELKEIVNDKAPAMLGYSGYVSTKDIKKKEEDAKMDSVLKNLKSYLKDGTKEEESDAI